MGRLLHVALFTWKPGTTDAEVAAVAGGLAELPSLIPAIRAYRIGPDAGLAITGNDGFAVVAEFDDADGFRTYVADPHHQRVVEGLLKPILQTRHAVQFTA